MASFEAIFATADAHGLHLNNLYQMNDGMFRANFRSEPAGSESWFSPMAENADPRAALEAALDIALAHLAKHPRKPAATVVHEHRNEAETRGLFD
jgi:hypothetical protein